MFYPCGLRRAPLPEWGHGGLTAHPFPFTLLTSSIPEHGAIPWRSRRCNRGRRLQGESQSLMETTPLGRRSQRTIREPEDLLEWSHEGRNPMAKGFGEAAGLPTPSKRIGE